MAWMYRSNLESMNLTGGQKLFALVFAILPSILKVSVLRSKGATIEDNVSIGFGTVIMASDFSKIHIGKYTRIAQFTIIACRAIKIGRYVRIQMFTWIWGSGKLFVDDKTIIGARVCIDLRHKDVHLGKSCAIATSCFIYTHVHMNPYTQGWMYRDLDVVLEDNVRLGLRCIVMPGVRIEKNTVVGAGGVVIKSLPPNAFAVGSPATVKGPTDRFREDIDEKEYRRRVEEIAEDVPEYFGYRVYSKKRSGRLYKVEFGVPGAFSTQRWTVLVADAETLKGQEAPDGLDAKRTVLFSTTNVPAPIKAELPLWFDFKDRLCSDLPTELGREIWNYLFERWEEICDIEDPARERSG